MCDCKNWLFTCRRDQTCNGRKPDEVSTNAELVHSRGIIFAAGLANGIEITTYDHCLGGSYGEN
jgi:hypothetical protein